MRTSDSMVRHILNLETVISIIAAFFYNVFITDIKEKKNQNKEINWNQFTLLRYVDWSLTTPFMLLSLCLFLSYNIKTNLKLFIILPIFVLNYVMLYLGYLGELNTLTRLNACLLGFIPLLGMIGIIYNTYIVNCRHLINKVIFYLFLVVWSLYGIAYMMDNVTKNIIINILDLISKAFIGIGMWLYYINVIHL
jgi:bacteriorhodopsin